MRYLILSIATAASALAIAAPASAQYYPPQQPGYGAPYGNAYGYNNRGNFRALDNRIDMIQRHISQLDRRNGINEREADRLKAQSRDLERQLAQFARNGLTPWEATTIERGIARLEQRVFRDVRDGRGWNNRGNQWGGNYNDRDRDGRNDRYEDDRGTRRD
jgi:hypothetical protein